MIQKSLVLMKPDAVKRGVVGEILHRFERAGLKVVGTKFVRVSEELATSHYKKDSLWKVKVGERALEECEKFGLDPKNLFNTSDPQEIGEITERWLFDYVIGEPVLALVLSGPNAVEKIRSLVGSTFPVSAPPGTIRGDYGMESSFSGLSRSRSVYNLIHASGTVDEANSEIKLWFKEEELLDYKTPQDELYKY